MKLILGLILLATTSCIQDIKAGLGVRKFAVGDCVIQSSKPIESWDKAEYVVTEIGKNAYLVKSLEFNFTMKVEYGYMWESFFQKVSCPNGR